MRASRNWDDRRVMPPDRVEQMFGPMQPCPFCNCPYVGLWVGPSPHVTCSNCGADGPTFDGRSDTLDDRQEMAVRAWNGSMPRPVMLKPSAI